MTSDINEIAALLDQACHLMMRDDSIPAMSHLGVMTCWQLAASLAVGRPVVMRRYPGTAVRCFTWAALRVSRWDPTRLTGDELFFAWTVRDVDLAMVRRKPSDAWAPGAIGGVRVDLAWG